MRVDTRKREVTFNVRAFGDVEDGLHVPHEIYTIVVEKALGRIDYVMFSEDYMCKYNDGPDITYIDRLEEPVYFTIIDPGEIDTDSIRIYIDGQLVSIGGGHTAGTAGAGHGTGYVEFVRWTEAGNKTYAFIPAEVPDVTDDLGMDMEGYKEGLHTLRIEAWDKSDAVNESDWRMLEKTVLFYIDTTPPVVVTHAAQRYGVRYFSSVEGATASITIVDEGSGVDGQDLQNDIFVDVFQHLTSNQTPLRTKDSGDIINFQRKVLIATTKPILEYCDDYTPDGIDNETWIGIHDGASTMRHPAWRASYTIHVGQISDGDTFEVVFYGDDKDNANMEDYNNENAVYLFEDLTNAYLAVWDGGTADSLAIAGAAGAPWLRMTKAGATVTVRAMMMMELKPGLLSYQQLRCQTCSRKVCWKPGRRMYGGTTTTRHSSRTVSATRMMTMITSSGISWLTPGLL
jgi:hypothetical protein